MPGTPRVDIGSVEGPERSPAEADRNRPRVVDVIDEPDGDVALVRRQGAAGRRGGPSRDARRRARVEGPLGPVQELGGLSGDAAGDWPPCGTS